MQASKMRITNRLTRKYVYNMLLSEEIVTYILLNKEIKAHII